MSFAWKGLLALVWLLAVPAASGALFFKKEEAPALADRFLAGYLLLFSSAEILTLPMIYFRLPLHVLTLCFGAFSGLAALAGLIRTLKYQPTRLKAVLGWLRGVSPFLWAALAVIAVQIAAAVLFAHFDADDAVYVGTAATAVETDSIFRINAYTGIPYQSIPRRYILSPFPIFLAVMSQLCGGLHAAIMAHTVFPAIFLVCVYTVLFQLGRKWFRNDRSAQGIFLLLAAVLCWFSSYSVYNTGNFQMVRLWQGKAMLAAFMLPLTFYLSSSILLEEKPQYSWLLLLMANIACCLLTSMGIIFAPLMIGLFTALGLLRFRSLKRTALGLACCLPSIALGLIYLQL